MKTLVIKFLNKTKQTNSAFHRFYAKNAVWFWLTSFLMTTIALLCKMEFALYVLYFSNLLALSILLFIVFVQPENSNES